MSKAKKERLARLTATRSKITKQMQKSLEYLNSPTKRAHDIAGATLLVPALAALWLPLRQQSKSYCNAGGNYLLRQERIGRNNKPFDVLKFRTLFERTVQQGPPPHLNVIDKRADKVGNIIRMLGLDETAQLVNVLRGEMSLVGPRPLLEEDIYSFMDGARDKGLAEDWKEIRNLTKPGILGPGQFYAHRKQSAYDPAGREIQMREDIRYIETASFLGDVAMIAKIPGEMYKLGSLALQTLQAA